MRDYAVNGRFDFRDYGNIFNLSTLPVTVANKWSVGPGINGGATVTFPPFPKGQTTVPGNPNQYMQIQWTAMPTQGEGQYLPGFRFTFLEYHMFNSMELMGGLVNFDFWMSSNQPGWTFRPIFWVNYFAGNYVIFDTPNVTYLGGWQHVTGQMNLPPPSNAAADASEYIGFGLDMLDQRTPIVALSSFRIWRPAEDIEVRPFALERYLSVN